MSHRFEVLTMTGGRCSLRFCDAQGRILIASKALASTDVAGRTIAWLRSALRKDWLYRIGRQSRGNRPNFELAAPFGVVCTSPAFSSCDAMEQAMTTLREAALDAPIVFCPAGAERHARAPDVCGPMPAGKRAESLGRYGLTTMGSAATAARRIDREATTPRPHDQ